MTINEIIDMGNETNEILKIKWGIIIHLENKNIITVKQLVTSNYNKFEVKEELIRKVVNSRSNIAISQLLQVNLLI